MKTLLKTLFIATLFLAPVLAVEDAEYCSKKCVPDHCKKFPSSAAMCKTDCPDMFAAC